jgi:antitoxin (DNA-binding transcriptional repressor) of toxin-antitoxin stability system
VNVVLQVVFIQDTVVSDRTNVGSTAMVISRIELDQVAEHLPELIEEVQQGGEVVLTRDDEPVAKLVAFPPVHPSPRFGSAKGLIIMSDDFDEPLEDFEEYMR